MFSVFVPSVQMPNKRAHALYVKQRDQIGATLLLYGGLRDEGRQSTALLRREGEPIVCTDSVFTCLACQTAERENAKASGVRQRGWI